MKVRRSVKERSSENLREDKSPPKTEEDNRGFKKAGIRDASIAEHVLAVAVGAIIYLLLIRPVLISYMSGPLEAVPEGENMAMAIMGESSVVFVKCGKDHWCSAESGAGGSCFELVKSEVVDEKMLRYSCGPSESKNEWVSYAKDRVTGRTKIGLWKNKQNAIPFKFYDVGDGTWRLQCKYPATGYDLWLTADLENDKAMILVADEEKASHFGFVQQRK
mmetsp:Transcript_26156/g.50839  ORF Transcript_26156/g.50839 Transcript_26156/m.50839 type:complete len:219 (+) Transcript_26156:2-658(+)